MDKLVQPPIITIKIIDTELQPSVCFTKLHLDDQNI